MSALKVSPELHYHLTHNHYPPAPPWVFAACQEIVEAGPDQDLDRTMEFVVDDATLAFAPAREVVRAFHLDAFWQ